MNHTFIFHEGVWIARGDYFDENGNRADMDGETRTQHFADFWENDSRIKLTQGGKSATIRNTYSIAPFEKGNDMTTWESCNPSLGILIGKFVVIGNTIISTCNSKDGTYTGAEFLLKIEDSLYRSWGAFFMGNQKLSSWDVKLKKVE
jgi:hypothetical protein